VKVSPKVGCCGQVLLTQYLGCLADIELLLTAVGAIEHSRIPGAETYEKSDGGRDADSDGEDEGFGGNRKKTNPTIRNQQEDDDDLDWDM
jgi:hypothetical protein